jgi:hypothetical protein
MNTARMIGRFAQAMPPHNVPDADLKALAEWILARQ